MEMRKTFFLFILLAQLFGGAILTGKLWTEIEIPVRDDNVLKADFYSTDTTVKKPVILIQTPYNKEYYRYYEKLPPQTAASDALFDTLNYNYVIVDWRGFYANSDVPAQGYDRGLDGYDIVEWIADQSWCNGKIGTSGSSALGYIQFQTARHCPPHLVCAAPFVKDLTMNYGDYYYGGVLRREHTEVREKLGFLSVEQIILHPTLDAYWKYIENVTSYADEIAVPTLMVSGWFDHYPSDIIRTFENLREKSDSKVKDKHKLVMGPWLHAELGRVKQGEMEYPEAENVAQGAKKRFFDYYLLGAKNGWILEPSMKYFVLGVNRWFSSDGDKVWEGDVSKDTLYLSNDFQLQKEPPISANPPDTIVYNPKNPSPTVGGSRFNPFEQNVPKGPMDIRQEVESRDDVLIYETEVFQKPLTIAGSITVELFVSSNRTDTDFGVRLCDVYPDGRSIILTQGIKRCRFRNGLEEEELMTPGEIYKISVELEDLAVAFEKGHKLKIVVSSSNYPMFDVNINDGGPLYESGDTLTAENLVYSDAEHPSKIIFPYFYPLDVKEESQSGASAALAYPNPAKERIQVSLSKENIGETQISIYDIFGVERASKTIAAGSSERKVDFDVSDLPDGVYFIRIRTKNNCKTLKFSKVK